MTTDTAITMGKKALGTSFRALKLEALGQALGPRQMINDKTSQQVAAASSAHLSSLKAETNRVAARRRPPRAAEASTF